MRGIIVDEDRIALVHQRLVRFAAQRQSFTDQHVATAPDEALHGLKRDKRAPHRLQHMVERSGEIAGTVDQGAVEIEEDDVEGDARHSLAVPAGYGNGKRSVAVRAP